MKKRPTSPHLSIYKPMITSSSSILGRLAGVYLYLISVVILVFISLKIQDQKDVSSALIPILDFASRGILHLLSLVLFSFTSLFAFWLFILACVRHLIWDFGFLLDLKPSKIMGWGMFIISFLLSIGLTFYMFFI